MHPQLQAYKATTPHYLSSAHALILILIVRHAQQAQQAPDTSRCYPPRALIDVCLDLDRSMHREGALIEGGHAACHTGIRLVGGGDGAEWRRTHARGGREKKLD